MTLGLVALAIVARPRRCAGDFKRRAVDAAPRRGPLLALRRRRLARGLHRRLPEGRVMTTWELLLVRAGGSIRSRSRSPCAAARRVRSPRAGVASALRAPAPRGRARRARRSRSRRRSGSSPTGTSSARTCCSTCCSCSSCRRSRSWGSRPQLAGERRRGRVSAPAAPAGRGVGARRRRDVALARADALQRRVAERRSCTGAGALAPRDGHGVLVADPRAARRDRACRRSAGVVYLFTACVGVHAPRHHRHVLAGRGLLGVRAPGRPPRRACRSCATAGG